MPDTRTHRTKIGRWLFSLVGSLEAIAFFFSALWGGWLASPFWNTFDSSPSFAVMAVLAPRLVWGGFPLLMALALLVVSVQKRTWAKRCLLLAMTAFWVLVWMAYAIANPRSTATASYPMYSVLYAWLWYMNGEEQE